MKDNQLCLLSSVAVAAAVAVEVSRVIDDGCGRAWASARAGSNLASTGNEPLSH